MLDIPFCKLLVMKNLLFIPLQIGLFLLAYCSFEVNAQTGAWTWIKGTDNFNANGNFGIEGVEDPDNFPPSLYGPVTWTDQQGNFWLFGGLSSSSVYNTLWKYDPVTNNWTWIKGSDNYGQPATYGTMGIPSATSTPGARAYGCLSWIDNNNDLWLYGGYGVDANGSYGVLADLWKYSISTNEWTWMNGSQNVSIPPSYGTFQQAASSNTPGSRWETTSNWIDANGNLWFFGGWDYFDSPRGDMWMYDVSIAQWLWMSGSSNSFPAPSYGTMGISSPTNQPGGRNSYTAYKDLEGNFWIFGGIKYGSSQEYYNDLWRFDPVTIEWTWMSGTNIVNNGGSAGPLCASDSSYMPDSRGENRTYWTDDCGNLWHFGGGQYIDYFNDLWTYRSDSNDWTFVKGSLSANQFGVYGIQGVPDVANVPGARIGAPSWRDTSGNFWLFGGYGIYGIHNDLWRYSPDPDCPSTACLTSDTSPASSLSASDTNVCEKFCIDYFDLSLNVPTGWQWYFAGGNPSSSTTQNPTQICYNNPGTYDVTLITTNAFGNDTLFLPGYITVSPTPPDPTITIAGNVLTSSPASSYQWQINGVDITGATNQSYTISQAGFYTVIIHDVNGCINDNSIDVLTIGIGDPDSAVAISIYPNPVSNTLNIDLGNAVNQPLEIKVLNSIGQLVYDNTRIIANNLVHHTVDLSAVPSGIYFVEVKTHDVVIRKKIVAE
jgi:hypothetical protein